MCVCVCAQTIYLSSHSDSSVYTYITLMRFFIYIRSEWWDEFAICQTAVHRFNYANNKLCIPTHSCCSLLGTSELIQTHPQPIIWQVQSGSRVPGVGEPLCVT